VEKAHKYLVGQGVEIFRVNEIPEVVKTLAILDPDGNKIVLVENTMK